ncbi:MAG: Clp protease [Bacteroidetes bacterium]|nr:Clp protease [Bacteroidota bacterium]
MIEILIYSLIDNQIAASFIQNLGWMGDDQNYTVRLYTPGGDPQAAWGMWAKMNELKANGCRSIAKIDGMACSTGGFLLCAFDEREALETSQIMIHRATYVPQIDEKGKPIPVSQEEQAQLDIINANFKERLAKVIDNTTLIDLKGYGIDDIFDENKPRINCFLTPSEALQIGLITKIVPIDAASSQTFSKAVAACYDTKATAAKAGINKPFTKMKAEELKEQDPECYKAIEEAAVKAYKKAKAKADKTGEDDEPDEEAKAKKAKAELDQKINAAVEKQLAAIGIQKIEGQTLAQTAEAQAKLAAKAADEQKVKDAKAEANKAAMAELDKELEAITTGKKLQ